MHQESTRLQARRRAKKRSGAAMLIVMLVLLVVTAGATMAVYSSQFESRAAGHQRQAMQTAQVAQAGLAAASTEIEMMGGARMLEFEMCMTPVQHNARLSVEEPPMNVGTAGTPDGLMSQSRRYASNEATIGTGLANSASVTYVPTDSAGIGMAAFEPRYIVDVNDAYTVPATFVGTGAGSRVDGNGTIQLRYLVHTITSRGRLTRTGLLNAAGETVGGVLTAAERDHMPAELARDIFETAVTARAWATSGPYNPQPCPPRPR